MSVGELAGSAASIITQDQRDRFGRTWFGTLLGQTLLTVLTLAAIAACIVFVYARFHETFPELFRKQWFWAVLLSLFAVVFVFQVMPTAIQGRRERQLRRLTITDAAHTPGVFLLRPYGSSDADRYYRPDGADDEAIRWLEGTDRTLIYLFGASGAGKSSLLGAGVLPRLKAGGWNCLVSRIYAEPAKQLRTALIERKDLFPKEPAKAAPLRTLLERVSQERVRAGLRPLLVVIDQFEEFLILNDATARAPLLELLHSLDKSPLPGLRLLCVFRSAYRELLFKLGLPAYVPGTNAFELAPFLRAEAEAFLRKGGRELSPEGYAALFTGLDRIEGAHGLYRPITLNMIGLVLERMGSRLTGGPERLMDAYLRDCLSAGASRDFAAPVLSAIITASGTKEPRDIAGIVAATRLEPWQVASTLTDLEGHGLVRPLDVARTRWEVSHDFLARQISILLGHLRTPWIRRATWVVLPGAALGWLATLFFFLVWWPDRQEDRALAELRELGFTQSGGGTFELTKAIGFTGEGLRRFVALQANIRMPLKGLASVTSIDLDRATGITSLEPLKGLTSLESLELDRAAGITNLEPLKGLTSLKSLELSAASGITSLEPLKGLTSLNSLELADAAGINSLEPLKGLTSLTSLELDGAARITSLEPLKGLTSLTSLDLDRAARITSLEPLKGLTSLTSLNLFDAAGITSLDPLKGLTSLNSLDLTAASGITSLEPLKGLTSLNSLDLTAASGITSLEPLKGLTSLTSLELSAASGITSLEPLKGLTSLSFLELVDADGITSLEPLKGLTSLTSLNLAYADGIASLEPLKGLTSLTSLDLDRATGIASLEPLKYLDRLEIRGASETLLETLSQ